MNIGSPPEQYDARWMAHVIAELTEELARAHQANRDIEVGQGNRVVFTDTANGDRRPVVLTSGALVVGAAL